MPDQPERPGQQTRELSEPPGSRPDLKTPSAQAPRMLVDFLFCGKEERKTDEDLQQLREHWCHVRWRLGTVASVALVASLVLGLWGQGLTIKDGGVKIYQAVVLAGWTLLPPIGFWFEYYFLFRPAYPDLDSKEFDRLKYGQDLSSKIWLAAVSVLLILYFNRDIRP